MQFMKGGEITGRALVASAVKKIFFNPLKPLSAATPQLMQNHLSKETGGGMRLQQNIPQSPHMEGKKGKKWKVQIDQEER